MAAQGRISAKRPATSTPKKSDVARAVRSLDPGIRSAMVTALRIVAGKPRGAHHPEGGSCIKCHGTCCKCGELVERCCTPREIDRFMRI